MPHFNDLLGALKAQVNSDASRSDVLKPLAWLTALLLFATVTSGVKKADSWLTLTLLILTVISVLTYVGAYIFFAIKSPDSLRSERHVIQKLAIEQGLLGDSSVGILNVTPEKTESTSDKKSSHQSKVVK